MVKGSEYSKDVDDFLAIVEYARGFCFSFRLYKVFQKF